MTADQHLSGATDNLRFADWLKDSEANDATTIGWAITALFYVAVHAVRAHLCDAHGVSVTAHAEMHGLVVQYPELRKTKRDYDWLKQESEAARYYLVDEFTWDDFQHLRKAASRVDRAWRSAIERRRAAAGR